MWSYRQAVPEMAHVKRLIQAAERGELRAAEELDAVEMRSAAAAVVIRIVRAQLAAQQHGTQNAR